MAKSTHIINKTSLALGIISAIICFISKAVSPSPFELIHILNVYDIMPPIWIFNLLSLIWYFLIGFGAGIVAYGISYCYTSGHQEILAYKGGLYFVSTFFLFLLWYPMFFSGRSLLISFLLILAAMICSIMCSCYWFKSKNSVAGLMMAAFAIWTFYVMFINLSVWVRN